MSGSGIEERLKDALAARAETVRDDGRPRAVPAPRIRLSRARWWAPLAVAAVLAAVVVATVVTTRSVVVSPAPAVRPTPEVVGSFSPPVKQVWPGAVHEIPVKAPGGRAFNADVFITDRVVVGRGLTRSRPDSIWAYDVDKRNFARIARLNDPHIMNAPLVFGDGFLAWSSFHDHKVEVWAVRATGGIPRRLASVPAMITSDNSFNGIDLAIGDGMAVWSPQDGGVYQVPLEGGRAALIDGTRGFYLLEWPWAGWPAPDMWADHPIRVMEHVMNVRTHERRDARAPVGRTSWKCALTWCFNGVEAWRRDGTGLRRLPGGPGDGLYSGRFVLLYQKNRDGVGAQSIYDVATGRTGLLFRISTRKASPTIYLQDGMFSYKTGRDTQMLVNLTAIRQ